MEFEGKRIRFPVGIKQTKPWLKKFARFQWIKCGVCGCEMTFDPDKDPHQPGICWDCNYKHTKERERLGLGGDKHRIPCMDCGRTIVRNLSANRSRCKRCKAKVRTGKTQLNPELRRKRFGAAVEILTRQYSFDEYAKPLSTISRKLYQPQWWDSASEIVVAAELLRLGHKLNPQKKVSGHKVDFFIPGENLLIEVDGDRYHSDAKARIRDRYFDARAILEGYKVVRIPANAAFRDVRKAVQEAFGRVKDAVSLKVERQAEIMQAKRFHLVDSCMATVLDKMIAQERKAKKRSDPQG